MTLTFPPADLFQGALDESLLGPPSAVVLEGEIAVRSAVPFTSDDARVLSGVWEAEPGCSRWEFLDRGEVILVLSGRMVVTQDGGEPVVLTAGTAAVFPIGWVGTWEITERIRKFFVVYRG
ncbi:cupin domain-containing protein [Nocardioides nitrophenolicus]|uniref:cupin domain-containing protein n=1 Tax=Nocardioides nitrophenolicus TaxID=60489 RepID=UPI0019562457|nr:cupin domain-containing protein [Nocardioides nitrophenolicus]MBM7517094.1 putative cupin superfamily protein [Nocardioides nitrophenolicus]